MNEAQQQQEQQEQQQNLDPLQLIDGDNPPDNNNNQNEMEMVQNMYNPSKIFRKASTHFNVTNAVLLFYSMLKVVVLLALIITSLYFSSCQSLTFRWSIMHSLQKWAMLIGSHSLISMIYYFLLVNWMSNEANKNLVAVKLGEVVQAEPQNEQRMTVMEESKKISILSMQIKYEVQKSNICGKWIGRLSFILFQLLFIWGLYLFFAFYDSAIGCDRYYLHYMTCILFLAIYQYIDFYIILILAVLCSPFLIIFLIYYCISLQTHYQCIKEHDNQQIINKLNVVKYKPNVIEGDQQCSICYCAYEIDEELIVLICSNYHHFHASCIKAWVRVSRTCPLCRTEIDLD